MKQFSLYSLSSFFMLHCNINCQSDILIFFYGERQELCLCIIEGGNWSVNKENRAQKHTSRG
jgi:hypothetical protein